MDIDIVPIGQIPELGLVPEKNARLCDSPRTLRRAREIISA